MHFRIAQNFSSNISATFATNNVLKPPNLVALKGTKTTTATKKFGGIPLSPIFGFFGLIEFLGISKQYLAETRD